MADTAGEQVDVVDVPEKNRVEIRVDGELAGFADYSRLGGRIIFRHTEIHDAYEGRGLGSKLAQGALDLARAAGHPVVPLCPFVASYIERHPEYRNIVDQDCLDYLERQPGS
jgi:predicted GNAT family acetyltransferase